MVNGIRTFYHCWLNKGFGSKFCVDSWDWDEKAEECISQTIVIITIEIKPIVWIF